MNRFSLTQDQKTILLKTARASIASRLNIDYEAVPVSDDPLLEEVLGVFVTLTLNRQLRGCIGNITGQYPLQKGVEKMAQQAAFHDPRFYPLEAHEFDHIHIEISVLSPLSEISPDQVEVGVHGLLIRHHSHSGVLLPQVPVEQGWNHQQYLEGLCRKAGLSPQVLDTGDFSLYGFTAFVFGDTI